MFLFVVLYFVVWAGGFGGFAVVLGYLFGCLCLLLCGLGVFGWFVGYLV